MPDRRTKRGPHHTGQNTRMMRRVATGGVLGALPGMLIVLIPLVLHEFGVITADQSQIGFIGVPLLFIGTIVGTLMAASDSGCTGAAILGVVGGFVAGLTAAVLIQTALRAAGAGLPVMWLFGTPIGMISGAALGVHLGARRSPGERC